MDQDDMSARIAALSNLSQDELRARFSAHPLTTTADRIAALSDTSSKREATIVSVIVRTPDRTDELTNVKDWFHGVGGALVVIHERDGYEVRSSYSDYLGYEVVTRKDDEEAR